MGRNETARLEEISSTLKPIDRPSAEERRRRAMEDSRIPRAADKEQGTDKARRVRTLYTRAGK